MTGWAYDKVYQSVPDLTEVKELIEEVAKAIYEEETSEWKEMSVKVPRVWRIPNTPWDSNDNELAEHEREDYRSLAVAAIKTMKKFMEKR